jgi:hypothetical protein
MTVQDLLNLLTRFPGRAAASCDNLVVAAADGTNVVLVLDGELAASAPKGTKGVQAVDASNAQ